MKIAVLSDLHGILPPEDWFEEGCELLLLAGDILPLGTDQNLELSKEWIYRTFKLWCLGLPFQHIVWIGGNHDFYCERCGDELLREFGSGKIRYLHNTEFTYVSDWGKEYKIFGTPYCHIYGTWAFMREPEILENKFSEIPEDLDILLCHDAPFGVSDTVQFRSEHLGNPELRRAILNKQPRYVFHGHLHTSNHSEERLRDSRIYNTSLVDESYSPVYKPLYLFL